MFKEFLEKIHSVFKFKVKSIPFKTSNEIKVYIYALNTNPHGFTLTDASRELHMKLTTVKSIVDRLINKGILEQIRDEEGNKRYVISRVVKLGVMWLYVTPFRKVPFTLIFAFLSSIGSVITLTTLIFGGNIHYALFFSSYILLIVTVGLWIITFALIKTEPI